MVMMVVVLILVVMMTMAVMFVYMQMCNNEIYSIARAVTSGTSVFYWWENVSGRCLPCSRCPADQVTIKVRVFFIELPVTLVLVVPLFLPFNAVTHLRDLYFSADLYLV